MYYTYIWSLVIAKDLFSRFLRERSIMNPAMARRYRRGIPQPRRAKTAAQMGRGVPGLDTTTSRSTSPPPSRAVSGDPHDGQSHGEKPADSSRPASLTEPWKPQALQRSRAMTTVMTISAPSRTVPGERARKADPRDSFDANESSPTSRRMRVTAVPPARRASSVASPTMSSISPYSCPGLRPAAPGGARGGRGGARARRPPPRLELPDPARLVSEHRVDDDRVVVPDEVLEQV